MVMSLNHIHLDNNKRTRFAVSCLASPPLQTYSLQFITASLTPEQPGATA